MTYDKVSFMTGLWTGLKVPRYHAPNVTPPTPPHPPLPPEPPVYQYERPTEAMYLDGNVYTITISDNAEPVYCIVNDEMGYTGWWRVICFSAGPFKANLSPNWGTAAAAKPYAGINTFSDCYGTSQGIYPYRSAGFYNPTWEPYAGTKSGAEIVLHNAYLIATGQY